MKYFKLYTLDNQFIEETNSWPYKFTGIIVYADGEKSWWKDGNRHRLDGPAIEHSDDGSKEWFVDGKRHRLDGPAVEWFDGSKLWCLDGEGCSREAHQLFASIMELKGII